MLAIIPARRGSKGVPGKALRTIGGKPLILRTLECVKASRKASRIVVTTDCPEIEAFCSLRGYEVIRRPDELGADDVPIMDVALHARRFVDHDGLVGIFQPTCPLLRPETVRDVVEEFHRRQLDWAITATPDPHIHWGTDPLPYLLTPRVQRQDQDVMVESGAVQLFNPDARFDSEDSRVGIIEIPHREALDIDTQDDMMLAERLCSLKNIHFVVLMGERVGTGHFHRSIALAQALSHHNISWEWRGDPPPWAVDRVPYPTAPEDGPVEVLIFDCLTPGQSEILEARSNGVTVIALEDESGDDAADLTINDMLDPDHVKYAVLRPEFLCLPEREQRANADRILLTFGGTDPASLADRCKRILDGHQAMRAAVAEFFTSEDDENVTATPPYGVRTNYVQKVDPSARVHMSTSMRDADLVITSQGRTVFEAAACGTPCISIAANERENRHTRIPGVTYLGLHSTVTDDQIRHAVNTTLSDQHLRQENAHAARQTVDGRGLERLVRLIEGVIA